jgi:hypothetical protein
MRPLSTGCADSTRGYSLWPPAGGRGERFLTGAARIRTGRGGGPTGRGTGLRPGVLTLTSPPGRAVPRGGTADPNLQTRRFLEQVFQIQGAREHRQAAVGRARPLLLGAVPV